MNDKTQPSVSALPANQTDAFQNMLRSPPVKFASGHGISQHFRGTVGRNATIVLLTNAVSLNSYDFSLLRGGQSTLTISSGKNPSGTGMDLSHNEKVGPVKPGLSPGRQAFEKVKRLNRIRSIIMAPIDQILEMEVAFGDRYSGSNTWKGAYASGATYQWTVNTVAPVAMIKLTCNNPLNPGWFSFFVSIHIKPPAPPPRPPAAKSWNQMDELKRGFGEMIRNISSGRNPW